jgi:hypothetical protein
LEAQLGAWSESVVASPATTAEPPEAAVAVDGKTLRGSRKQGAPGAHLLSALSHRLGLTLAQQAVDDKTNEITEMETVLGQIVLQDHVVTIKWLRVLPISLMYCSV